MRSSAGTGVLGRGQAEARCPMRFWIPSKPGHSNPAITPARKESLPPSFVLARTRPEAYRGRGLLLLRSSYLPLRS